MPELTPTTIKAAVKKGASGERVELADDDVEGLRLRAGEKGAKWSLLARTPTGERIRVPVGSWPATTLADARKAAREVKERIKRGANPNAERKAARHAVKVGELLETYTAAKLRNLRTGKATRRSLDIALQSLLTRAAQSVTRRDIAEIVDKHAARAPAHANRMLAYMNAFFGWAVGRGSMEANPASAIAKPLREVPRERTPEISELVEIWQAAGRLGYPFGPAIRLLVAIPARREEAIGIEIGELKLPPGESEGEWLIPEAKSKNGRAIRVPLPPLARGLIEEAMRSRRDKSRFLFTTTGDTPASGWSKAKARLDGYIKEARRKADPNAKPMPAWRLHDLRRSFATIACEALKVDAAVADRCLNHVGAATSSTVQRVYGRSELFDQRRDALRAWGEFLACEIGKARQ